MHRQATRCSMLGGGVLGRPFAARPRLNLAGDQSESCFPSKPPNRESQSGKPFGLARRWRLLGTGRASGRASLRPRGAPRSAPAAARRQQCPPLVPPLLQLGAQPSAMEDLNGKAAQLQDKLSDLHADFSQSAAKQVGHFSGLCGRGQFAPRHGSPPPSPCGRAAAKAAWGKGILTPTHPSDRARPVPASLQADPPAAAEWQQQWEAQARSKTAQAHAAAALPCPAAPSPCAMLPRWLHLSCIRDRCTESISGSSCTFPLEICTLPPAAGAPLERGAAGAEEHGGGAANARHPGDCRGSRRQAGTRPAGAEAGREVRELSQQTAGWLWTTAPALHGWNARATSAQRILSLKASFLRLRYAAFSLASALDGPPLHMMIHDCVATTL